MHERLKGLHSVGTISESICQNYDAIQKDFQKAYLLSLKYNITGQKFVKDRCINYIQDSVEYEKEVLVRTIDEIKSNLL